jgi:3-oxoadipate enol-lactonase
MSAFADVNDTRLHYEETGAGPALVLVHGHGLDRRMWDDQVPAFAPRRRVIRYDLRGYGRSALPAAPFTHHDDLLALLDHLRVDRACVVGLSLGGSVAVNFALVHPARVRALVLVATSAVGGFFWPDELAAAFAPIHEAGRRGDMALAKRLWLAMPWFAPAREHPELRARLEAIVADYSGHHFAHDSLARSLKPPANDRLHEITAPTLVIVGERDLAYYNLPLADRLASQIANAQKVVMTGVGHMANMEDSPTFNRVVLEFLARLA